METTSGYDLFYSTEPWSEPNNLSQYCSSSPVPQNDNFIDDVTCCHCRCHATADPLKVKVAFLTPNRVETDSVYDNEKPALSEASAIPEFVPRTLSRATNVEPDLKKEEETEIKNLLQLPKSSTRMRSINWQKLPKSAVFNEKSNLWKSILMKQAGKQKSAIDFIALESMLAKIAEIIHFVCKKLL